MMKIREVTNKKDYYANDIILHALIEDMFNEGKDLSDVKKYLYNFVDRFMNILNKADRDARKRQIRIHLKKMEKYIYEE